MSTLEFSTFVAPSEVLSSSCPRRARRREFSPARQEDIILTSTTPTTFLRMVLQAFKTSLIKLFDDDHGPPGESLPDPRVEGPDVSSSINLDSTDTGESVSTSAGDTTMVSGIDPPGNKETREQNIEPASKAQSEVQDSIQVNAEEQMDVSKEIEKSRPRWETISSDWSNRTIKDYRTSIKAFIISPYEG